MLGSSDDSGEYKMLAEISAGLGSLMAAKDIVQAMNGIQTAVQINDLKLNLQGLILDAQQSLFSAQQEQLASAQIVADLKKEIVQLKDWTAEKERYERADTGNGTIAYRRKAGMDDGEPPHWLCPQCFLEGKPSILQPEKYQGGTTILHRCNNCGTKLITSGSMGAVSPSRK
jgi:hypothetical protein